MKQRVLVSVPGKLILMGEHAAVYGRPALVTAVAPRASVSVTANQERLVIDLPDLGERSETSWAEITARADSARNRWARYAEQPTPERFQALENDSPEHLVAIALGEVAHELGTTDLPSIQVRVVSELPIGSGFGSSAATAVGVIGATLAFLGHSADRDRIDRIALEVERRQHGLPSGVDHKTVLFGGVVWARRHDSGHVEVEPLKVQPALFSDLLVFHTGRPEETTGEVVAAVRRRLEEENPNEFEQRLDTMGRCVEALRDYLCGSTEANNKIVSLMRTYERCLEEIGVVPTSVQEVVRAVEALDGGAKISGAGALSGDAAGCLLVHGPALEPGRIPRDLEAYHRQPVELGAEGFRIEEIV